MTTGKWSVHRSTLPWTQEDGEWFAVPVYDDKNEGKYFPTHAEALAYADRMARHGTPHDVPRVKVIPTDRADRRADMTIHANENGVNLTRPAMHPWKLKWRPNDQTAYIPNSQLEEVALHLLALANRGIAVSRRELYKAVES